MVIDKEWRSTAGRKLRRKVQTMPAEPIDRAGSGETEQPDKNSDDDGSEVNSVTEDELAQYPEN
jgi:hypothetical protein